MPPRVAVLSAVGIAALIFAALWFALTALQDRIPDERHPADSRTDMLQAETVDSVMPLPQFGPREYVRIRRPAADEQRDRSFLD